MFRVSSDVLSQPGTQLTHAVLGEEGGTEGVGSLQSPFSQLWGDHRFQWDFHMGEVQSSSMTVEDLILVFSCPGFIRKRGNQKLVFHIKWFLHEIY